MQIIYLYFIFILFIFFIPNSRYLEKKNVCYSSVILQYLPLIILIALFFGIRNIEIGLDSKRYLEWFRDGPESTLKQEAEKGFELFMFFLHNHVHNDNSFLFIMSLLIISLDFLFYYKLDRSNCCKYIVLMTCFYYFYLFHLNICRQAIAIGIVGISYIEYRNKKIIPYLVLGLIAFSIHFSALIFLLFPIFTFFAKRIDTRFKHFIFIILTLVFLRTSIIKTLISYIPDFAYPVKVLKSYMLYLNLGKVHFTHSHLVTCCIMLVSNYFFNNLKQKKYFDFYMLHTVFFCFISLFSSSVLLYDRFYFYIQIYEPFLLYQFYNLFREKRLAKDTICFVILLYSLFTIFIWGPRNVISPYCL